MRPVNNQFSLFLLILLLLGTAALSYFSFRSKIGPEQPIAFSHRVHVQEKNISCFMCHEGAVNSARAGVPPLETCMLWAHYEVGTPVEWKKVYDLPDFAYFNHSVHVFRKIDCAQCHGNVRSMDRIERVQEFKMKFCVDCHKEKKATTDCFTCHR